MTESSVLGSLGLAARSGKIAAGSQPVTRALQQKQAYLLLFDPGTGGATHRKFAAMAETAGVPWLDIPFPIGPACGYPACKLLAVTHPGMAENLLAMAGQT